jgi:NitT/TauT family transport system substrate-binding protein
MIWLLSLSRRSPGRYVLPVRADEAELIAGLIERDAPYYDAEISRTAIEGLMRFAQGSGLIGETIPYEQLVATQYSHLWKQ